MIRFSHRMPISAVSSVGLVGPSDRIVGNGLPIDPAYNESDPVGAGIVYPVDAGTWERPPQQIVDLYFADSVLINVSLTSNTASIVSSRVCKIGSSFVRDDFTDGDDPGDSELSETYLPPAHESNLAEEYDLAPSGETQVAPRTLYQNSEEFGGALQDSTHRATSSVIFPGGNSVYRAVSATYYAASRQWVLPIQVQCSTEWNDEGAGVGSTFVDADPETANFSTPMLGGTFYGLITDTPFGGGSGGLTASISVSIATYRPFYV